MNRRYNESFDSARRRKYFLEHKDESQFPLDGSDWARLVRMRLDRGKTHQTGCVCHHCDDFWGWLHRLTGPLQHERLAFQRATHHWFLLASDNYGMPWYSANESHKAQVLDVLRNLVADGRKKSLDEIEQDWLRARSAAKAWLPNSGGVWMANDSESGESRAIPDRGVIVLGTDLNQQSDAIMTDSPTEPILLKDNANPILRLETSKK